MTILQWTNTTSLISKWGTFYPFLSLVILFLVLPRNFIVLGVKSSRCYLVLILNVILFSILFIYILIDGLSKFSPCFLRIYSKESWISDIKYDLSGNSNTSFYVGADTLNLLLLYGFSMCN